ncbi:MAG: transcription antitermination factor NusB [Christensenellales bacterium]
MSRTEARECGFKMIYQSFFNNQTNVESFFDSENTQNDVSDTEVLADELQFANNIFSNYKENQKEVEEKLQNNLKNGLKLSDIYSLDKAILFATIVQIDYLHEPLGLAINEAVRIAKKYSTDKSSKFVNGVLSSIYKG